jgi:flagellin FlaB
LEAFLRGILPAFAKARFDERGITGLETAIILIAFVVVASVFAYTVLTAGIYSSQKSNEAVNAAIEEVRSSVILNGNVLAYAGDVDIDGDTTTADTQEAVVKIGLEVAVALRGTPIDLTPPYIIGTDGSLQPSGLQNTLVIDYVDAGHILNEVAWTVRFAGSSDGDYSLEQTERAEVTVWLVQYLDDGGLYYTLGADSTDPFADDADTLLTKFESFTLEISPVQGAQLSVERVAPQALAPIMNLR